jgi:hypothetical protein
MPRLALLLWPAAMVVGLAAERVGFGWTDLQHWAPDLITGWSLIAVGLIAGSVDRTAEWVCSSR